MKKTISNYILLSISLLLILGSCQKAEQLTYSSDANIYFDLTDDEKDSIVYTFAYNLTKSVDTIYVPVSISGIRESKDRFFKVEVDKSKSTAVSDRHYKALEAQYPMLADSGKTLVPIIVYNVEELSEKSVSISLKLTETSDFGIENPDIISAKVVVSARLEQPIWWAMWLGSYSRTKHQLFLITTGQTTLTTNGLDAPKNLYFVDLLNIMLRNPFQWVEKNAAKGYVLESKDNGASYQFYHQDNPNRPLLLKKNAGSGQYFFIDELGLEVR